MKNIFWSVVLVILIPLWVVLYLSCLVGALGEFLWETVYQSVYKLAGSPLDSK